MGVKITHRPPDYAKQIGAGLAPIMKRAAAYLQSSADKKIRDGVPPPNAPLTQQVKGGSQTLRDNGQLAHSIAPHSGETWADASTNLAYARIQQEGGEIRAKKAKALWIPANARARSLMRSYSTTSPRALLDAMKADGYEFFRPSGSQVFWAKKGKRGQAFPLFILRKSVTIPARPFLYIDPHDEAFLMKLIEDGVRKSLQGNK